ncbi:hypothetical protein OEZ85_008115 [Tetradesmus obliquus]|uniref:Anaphase-promoting complex subunit 4 WD40 domain-containing protein n=1 Tax=Tetradesmus obliquus TaxID=3088 RepID=A0ABY8TI88_TETOB|nr:hypothetical protein OEZ85_008115 [Tetradesmus obliquus]
MAWVLSPGDVAVWRDAPVEELLDDASRPVRLPLTQSSQAMPLFSALSVESASCDVTVDPAEQPQQHTFNVDSLLVGCWDGNVAIWQLPTTAGSSAQPIQLLRADPTPIHSVAWQPHKRWWLTGDTEEEAAAVLDGQSSSASSSGSAASSTSAAHSCRYFLTASNIGNVRVWDAQDVLQPLHERVVSRNAINAALWMGPPHMVVVASADGVLRQIWLDAGAQATTITTQVADVSGSCGSIWSIAGCEVLSVVAYVSDGGLLGVLPLEPPTGENRHRKSHAALSAVAVDDDQLWLLSAREVPGNGGLYENVPSWQGSHKKGRASEPVPTSTVVLDPLPHPDQVLHSVSFSPNYRGSVSLAYGGGAGVVRVHTVSAEVVPTGM